jgi:dCTP deaminase
MEAIVISGKMIIEQVNLGNIEISPFNADQAGPNSFDLRLGEKLVESAPNCAWQGLNTIDTHRHGIGFPVELQSCGGFLLQPGTLYLGHTVESIYSEYFAPILHGRSTAARHGVQVHLAAGFGDVGLKGQYVLEIVNHNKYPVMIYPYDRICQVSFERVEGNVELYHSDYQGQTGIRLAKSLADD